MESLRQLVRDHPRATHINGPTNVLEVEQYGTSAIGQALENVRRRADSVAWALKPGEQSVDSTCMRSVLTVVLPVLIAVTSCGTSVERANVTTDNDAPSASEVIEADQDGSGNGSGLPESDRVRGERRYGAMWAPGEPLIPIPDEDIGAALRLPRIQSLCDALSAVPLQHVDGDFGGIFRQAMIDAGTPPEAIAAQISTLVDFSVIAASWTPASETEPPFRTAEINEAMGEIGDWAATECALPVNVRTGRAYIPAQFAGKTSKEVVEMCEFDRSKMSDALSSYRLGSHGEPTHGVQVAARIQSTTSKYHGVELDADGLAVVIAAPDDVCAPPR